MAEKILTFDSIDSVHYRVTADISGFPESRLQRLYEEVNRHEDEVQLYNGPDLTVSSLNNGEIEYTSETLLPDVETITENKGRKKILFIFGNPAVHSIFHRMFFFSQRNLNRHRMWGKLDYAGVINQIHHNLPEIADSRREEADERKEIILNGNQDMVFLVGLTTFYSFPTSAGAAGGVNRVEIIFRSVLGQIQEEETVRILNGDKYKEFSKDAIFIFVQQSSYKAFLKNAPDKEKDTIFWPLRGAGSSGTALKDSLDKMIQCDR